MKLVYMQNAVRSICVFSLARWQHIM